MIFLWPIVFGLLHFILTEASVFKSDRATKSNYSLVGHVESSYNYPVEVYRSLKTGMHIIIAKVDGPVVNGYFSIATETSDNDGNPHALEHLVFLGSEDYPYKGVLDLLANRCLARGTNAWTDVDHTAYTLKTGGSEGFLNLLPIYLDHLFYPTLRDSFFVTEIHHITGKGEDAGVVYSEMQGVENTGGELTWNAVIREIYPDPSGYRYETGGMLSNLRESTSNAKIRAYQKRTYRPENTYVIVAGPVNAEDIFLNKNFQKFEDKVETKEDRRPFVKQWQDPVPKFKKSSIKEVLYPSDVEENGIVRFGFRGPSINSVLSYLAVDTLLDHFTESSVSIITKAFIDIPEPLATQVHSYLLRYSSTGIIMTFTGVPIKKIRSIDSHLNNTLHSILNGSTAFDVKDIRDYINKKMLKQQSTMEYTPHYTMATNIIRYTLYGKDIDDLSNLINEQRNLKKLLTKDKTYWLKLLEKYIVNVPKAVILGIPSAEEAKRLQNEHKKRIEERKIELGEDGLRKKQEILENATRINSIQPPDSVLQSIPIPSIRNIKFLSINISSNINNIGGDQSFANKNPYIDLKKVPIKVELGNVSSGFVQMVLKMDTSSLSAEDRLYLPLLKELLLSSSLNKSGTIIFYQEVVKRIHAETTEATILSGIGLRTASRFSYGAFSSILAINIKVPLSKYSVGLGWMKDVLYNLIFDSERIKVRANLILNSVDDNKRDGTNVLSIMYNRLVFKKESNFNRGNSLVQQKFLTELLKKLKANSTEVIAKIQQIYKQLTHLDNLSLFMATNFRELSSIVPNITNSLVNFTPSTMRAQNFGLNVIADSDLRRNISSKRSVTGYITGLGSLESAFLIQTTSNTISNYSHPDLPAIMITISYFEQLEGPLWREIRGVGAAYSYSFRIRPQHGTLSLGLYRAAQPERAYGIAKNLIESFLNGTREFNHLLYESAISSLSYSIIAREEAISDIVQQSALATSRKVSPQYNRDLLEKIAKTSFDDMKKAFHKYFPALFDVKQSTLFIVCQKSKVTDITNALKRLGQNLENVPSLENSLFSE